MRLKAELSKEGGGDGATEDFGEGYPGGGEHPVPHQLAPLPAKIIKEVVEKEVEVEKIVEKEIIIEQGPTPEEVAAMTANLQRQNEEVRQEAERKRAEIEKQRDMADAERQRYLQEVDREEKA